MAPATPYESPALGKQAYNCPRCGAFAAQSWSLLYDGFSNDIKKWDGDSWSRAYCEHCKKVSVWRGARMVWPSGGAAPMPNPDLPDAVMRDYLEAREVLDCSPRAAAALLRLAVQRLCSELGQSTKGNLDQAIGNLVKNGLPVSVQQALDGVRVVGNNAVHPGVIDLNDSREFAVVLFDLVNHIADRMISEPKRIAEIYAKLPQAAREAIERRDGARSSKSQPAP